MAHISPEQLRMYEAEKEIDKLFGLAAAKSGISPSAYDILYALEVYGDGCTQKELCDRCWLGKQTVNSSVKRLVEKGIIASTGEGGRLTRIVLTDGGRALAEQRVHPFIEADARAFEALAPADREAIVGLTERYRDAIRTSYLDAGLL